VVALGILARGLHPTLCYRPVYRVIQSRFQPRLLIQGYAIRIHGWKAVLIVTGRAYAIEAASAWEQFCVYRAGETVTLVSECDLDLRRREFVSEVLWYSRSQNRNLGHPFLVRKQPVGGLGENRWRRECAPG
jgi:hypothetical protein